MVVGTGAVVSYLCTVHDERGAVVSATPTGEPVRYVHGVTAVLAGIAEALEGASVGDQPTVVLDAPYGPHDAALVHQVDRALWPPAHPPRVGSLVRFTLFDASGAGTPIVGSVTAVDHKRVVVDGNPPLAGQRLSFTLTVLDARPATEHERATGHVPQFPFDVLEHRDFDGPVGDALVEFAALSMTPPFPWGQAMLGRVLEQRLPDLPGEIIECGVGLGGMSLFLARITDRTVYALDTFEGLPEADPRRDNAYWVPGLYAGATPLLQRFRDAAHVAGLSHRVVPIQGLFADTLPTLPDDVRFAVAHLDSDLYHSVWDSLVGVWDRLVDGGILVIDDFFHHAQGPLRACSAFFNERGLQPVYHVVFPYSVAVVKGELAPTRGARSLDGNCYAFDWLRADPTLRETLAGSIEHGLDGTRAHANALRLRALLDAESSRTSDIYEYWRSLEAWWDGISTGFTHAEPL